MTNYKAHIISDPKIMLGKPCIKGTRITVELILTRLSEGASTQDLLEAYPYLNADQILACSAYAADVIASEELITA